ncbi:MAG: IS630 family transposase [Proteobacteria bacterium]|nr:IS630 family transposase [Pseudomonadota bacterium]
MKILIEWIKENAPGNRETIKDFIWKNFGIDYTVSAVTKLLKKNGIKKIKPKLRPGKPPSLTKQYGFILHYLMLKKLQHNDESMVQLFVDGMHLVHQVIPTLYWGSSKDRLTFNTNSSRNRLNILGAYDVQTHTLVHLTSEANCDAEKVIEFLKLICKVYHEKDSIILHMDNAPYFHAEKVRNWLKKHPQIVINALPAYAPNLNLIERLWRFIKGELVRNRYYAKYKTFRAKVFRLLNNLENHTEKLKTLITDNFEIVPQE